MTTSNSLYAVLTLRLKKSARAFALVFVVSLLCTTCLSLLGRRAQVQSLILYYAASLSESALSVQDALSIQREVNRFWDSVVKTQSFDGTIEIFIDGRLVASSGQEREANWFSNSLTRTVVLASGSQLKISSHIDLSRKVFSDILIFLLIGLIGIVWMTALFFALKKALAALTHPLAQTTEWISTITQYLPTSLGQVPPSGENSVSEVVALQTSVSKLTAAISALYEQEKVISRQRAFLEIASQVSHDIRSPLAALNMVIKTIDDLPEEKRLLVRGSVGRIRDIANNLLQTARTHGTENSPSALEEVPPQAAQISLISSLLDTLITEKRMQFRALLKVEIDFVLGNKAYGIFSSINIIEFKRVLSNLVNNAVEAIKDDGRVTVSLGQHAGNAVIMITDTGQGIPPEILARLGQKGETHGKVGGSGLGLYHARTTVGSWGGQLELNSKVGSGTTVTISLPMAVSPKWFVPKLTITKGSKVVVVDDDGSIHQIWNGRFASARTKEAEIEVLHFSTPRQLKEWVLEYGIQDSLFLVDFELLGFQETGLELIETLKIQNQSILVTSRFEEDHIRTRCERLGVCLIPKTMAAYVPIEISGPKTHADAILIDDDPLVHATWKMAARQSNKQIEVFDSQEAFAGKVDQYDRDVAIYVDVSLGGGVRGEAVAVSLHDLGFTNIWLATGYEANALIPPGFIRGVVGKEPPFGQKF